MHAISFMYWFYGAIQAGQVSIINRGSVLANNVLAHIELVEEMNEYIDSRTKASLEMIYQIKGLISFNGLNNDNILELQTMIESIIANYENKPRTCAAYYLQGAFELGDIEYVRIYQSYIVDFPDCDLVEKLKFLFQICDQRFLSLEMTINLKIYVDNIFVHVINKQKLDSIKDQADTKPLPNGGRLKPVDQPVYPGSTGKLELLC
jgi:hypothetical protein